MTQWQLFDVVTIALGAIKHYPATAERKHAFWTLEVTFANSKEEKHTIIAFASAREHLVVATAPHPENMPLLRPVAVTPPSWVAAA